MKKRDNSKKLLLSDSLNKIKLSRYISWHSVQRSCRKKAINGLRILVKSLGVGARPKDKQTYRRNTIIFSSRMKKWETNSSGWYWTGWIALLVNILMISVDMTCVCSEENSDEIYQNEEVIAGENWSGLFQWRVKSRYLLRQNAINCLNFVAYKISKIWIIFKLELGICTEV